MKKLTAYFILLVFFVLKAYDIDAIVKTAGTEKTYEDANAINVFTEVIYDLNDDGTFTHKVFYVKKILNYSGQSRYSDVDIEYDPGFEKVELVTTLTVTPEGEKLEVPENQIYDLNTDESLWSPEYVKHRKKVINFPQIGPGYFIVLEYTVTDTRKLPLSGIEHFQESNPYLEKNLIIKYPKGMEIKYYADKKLTLKKDKEGKKTVLKWSVKDSPLIKNEPYSPDYIYSGTPVIFSFYKDWAQYNKDEFSKIFKYETTDIVKDLAAEITSGLKTDDEKIKAIYTYLAKNFDSKYGYISLMDLTPEPLDKVIGNKYGSEREMTALFLALAEQAGVKGWKPALRIGNQYDQAREKFKGLVVKDMIDAMYVYKDGLMLKPGEKSRPFAFSDAYECHIILPSKNEPVKYSFTEEPQVERTYDLSVSGNNVLIKVSSLNRGQFDSWMRSFERFPEQERGKRFFEWTIRDNAAELTDGPYFDSFDDLTKPIIVSYGIKRSSAAAVQDDYTYYMVSEFENLPDVSLTERTTDFYIGSRIFNKYIYKIDGSQGKVINLADSYSEFEFSGHKAYIKTVLRGNEYTTEYNIPEMLIPKEKYMEFRDFINPLKNQVNFSVFMKGGKQ
ncbi:MAG TPA: DUF3857 and transglutaminase domain-containing protein [Clostridiales bacterium]|nr:DUF3857 and transglutaminase domain-containing protein [Clostridiales bacterium]